MDAAPGTGDIGRSRTEAFCVGECATRLVVPTCLGKTAPKREVSAGKPGCEVHSLPKMADGLRPAPPTAFHDPSAIPHRRRLGALGDGGIDGSECIIVAAFADQRQHFAFMCRRESGLQRQSPVQMRECCARIAALLIGDASVEVK